MQPHTSRVILFAIVQLLLDDSRANPATDNDAPIWYASQNGHTDVVHLLLTDDRVNPTTYARLMTTNPFRLAAQNSHIEIIQLLLDGNRINAALSAATATATTATATTATADLTP